MNKTFLRFFFLILFGFLTTSFFHLSCETSDENNQNGTNDAGAGPGAPSPASPGGGTSRRVGTPPAETISHTGSFPNLTGWFDASFNTTGRGSSGTLRIYRPSNTTNLPLLILFAGSGQSTETFIGEFGGEEFIQNGLNARETAIVIVAPPVRQSTGDWDHGGDGEYWNTTTDSDSNPDLVFVRGLIQEARDRYNINPSRVYVGGFSSGAFFSTYAAMQLRTRIAAFSERSGGWVRCLSGGGGTAKADNQSAFLGISNCATMLASSNSNYNCTSTGHEPFTSLPTDLKTPGFLSHGTQDPSVSPYYSCDLERIMREDAYPVQLSLTNDGHSPSGQFFQPGNAWDFMRAYSL